MEQVQATKSLRILLYKAMILFMRLLGIGTIVAIAIFLLPLAVPYIKNALSFKYIRIALDIEKSVSLFVQDIIPTKIAGKDVTRWIVIVAAFLLGGSFSNLKERYRNKVT